jgi:hypothetical protein
MQGTQSKGTNGVLAQQTALQATRESSILTSNGKYSAII